MRGTCLLIGTYHWLSELSILLNKTVHSDLNHPTIQSFLSIEAKVENMFERDCVTGPMRGRGFVTAIDARACKFEHPRCRIDHDPVRGAS